MPFRVAGGAGVAAVVGGAPPWVVVGAFAAGASVVAGASVAGALVVVGVAVVVVGACVVAGASVVVGASVGKDHSSHRSRNG